MSSMFLAMQTAMKHHEMKKMLQEQKQEKLIKKKLKEKEFNIDVLSSGGTTYWKQQYTDSNGKTKTKDVKITVVLQGKDSSEFSNKGKFSFTNALGNKIFLSVRSYEDAYKFVDEIYGKVGNNSFYNVSKEI